MLKYRQVLALAFTFTSAALIAACGGGGGGGGTIAPPPNPSPSPSPSPSPQLIGVLNVISGGTNPSNVQYAAAGPGSVVFSCGCSGQAGTATTDGSGTFTLVQNAPATPAPPATYSIVPGRNYLVVAKAPAGNEAWTLQFLGNQPSHNHYLEGGTNVSDVYTAAAALYVFFNSSSSATAFDTWDFTTVDAWISRLKNSPPNTQESALLNDIVTESAAHHTLFPAINNWSFATSANGKIATDLTNVHNSGDPALPHDCGTSPCGAEPTP